MERNRTGRARFYDTLVREGDYFFDKTDPRSVSAALALRGNRLLSVCRGYHFEGLGEALTKGRDYTFDGTTLSILPSFLETCPAEQYTILSAEFDKGQSAVIPVFCTETGALPEYPLYRLDEPDFQMPRFDRFIDASLETNPALLRQGRPALRLAYDFKRTPKYFPAVCKERRRRLIETPRPIGVAVWIYGDGSGNRVSMKINSRDKASVFSENAYLLTWTGWRRILFRFDQSFPLPAIFDNLLFLEYVENAQESGVIRLSDMDILCSPADLSPFGDPGEVVDPDAPDPQEYYKIDFEGCTKGRPCRVTVTKQDNSPPDAPVVLKIIDCRQKNGVPYPIKKAALSMRRGVLQTRRFTKEEYPDDLVFFLRARDGKGRVSPLLMINAAPVSSEYTEAPTMVTRGVTKDPATSMAFAWFTALGVSENFLKIWPKDQNEDAARQIPAQPAYAREWIERVMVSHTRVDINREAVQFDVEATGLAPDTTYCCRFGAGEHWSEVFSCRTLPEKIERFDAVLMTDAQIGDAESYYPLYRRLMKQGIAKAKAPYVMLSLGDLVDSAGKQNDYRRTLGAAADVFAEEIWIPTPGNHEWEHIRDFENYKSHWNLPRRGDAVTDELLYSVFIGPVCFVSVPGYGGGLPPHFVSELEKELAAVSGKNPAWVVVLMHSSPYGKSGESFNPRYYVPVFERYGVDLALCGHDHLYVRSTMWKGERVPVGEGITYVSLGFAGPSHDRNCRFPWQDYVFGDDPAQVTKDGRPDPTCAIASFSRDRLVLTTETASGVLVDEIVLEKR